mgnify:CR=1 FL=1|jgi:uncharacterized protein YwgA
MGYVNTSTEYWDLATSDWDDFLTNLAGDFGGYSNFGDMYGQYMTKPDTTLYGLYSQQLGNTYTSIQDRKKIGTEKEEIKSDTGTLKARQTYEDTMRTVDEQLGRLGVKSGSVNRAVRNLEKQDVQETMYDKRATNIEKKVIDNRSTKDIHSAQIARDKGQRKEIEKWFTGTMHEVRNLAHLEAFQPMGNTDNPGLTVGDYMMDPGYYDDMSSCASQGGTWQWGGMGVGFTCVTSGGNTDPGGGGGGCYCGCLGAGYYNCHGGTNCCDLTGGTVGCC